MKVCVIGAGAAGMLVAGMLGHSGIDVTVLEKNSKVGRKLYITGKGRCNLTNLCDAAQVIDNTVGNPRFLYSAINAFTPQDTVEFFNSLGVETKVERGGRVFPLSDKSSDVIDALRRYIYDGKCKVIYDTTAISLIVEDNAVKGVACRDNLVIDADAVVIACGGASYPATGSTGDGYSMARNVGHNIIPIRPALVSMICELPISLAGLSLKNVLVTAFRNNKEIDSRFGEMLFTHTGVSGPIILTLSSIINKYSNRDGRLDGDFRISIDLKPALSHDKLCARIIRDIEEQGGKSIKNILPMLMPRALIPHILSQAHINPDLTAKSLNQLGISALADAIKSFSLKISRLDDVDKGIVTSGGVDVREVNPKDCSSKIISGLYFAGEVLDVDAFTGGYNLQIAFSTAAAVARGLAQKAVD
ncbi:MAG: NAD(P)/FAD-dependent oxidoreductase [Clostridia bacterium]|nr:NAD(P)/FAD-dependent oxidoreductase [Clostridia bacterium]